MNCIEGLADELIACRCGSRFGTNPLGLIYDFLLKAYGDPKQARADFVRFLSGELPAQLLHQARAWVSQEQELALSPSLSPDRGGVDMAEVIEIPDDLSWVTLQAPDLKLVGPLQTTASNI